MATPTPVQPRQVGILILDEADNNQGALRQILDSEGWRVRLVQDPKQLLTELKSGEWSLVIANIAMAGTDTPIFITLRELEQRYIHEVLSATGNNKTAAARILGIHSTSLMRRLKKEEF